MDLATILAFAAAFFVFAASPGPDNMTIVARTISSGAVSGIAYGAGTVVGSIMGALMIGLINNGLVLMGLEFSQQLIARGAIIIIAVAISQTRKR